MPDLYTPNYNLTMPEVGQSKDTWGDKWNSNASRIDDELKRIDTSAADAAASKVNRSGDTMAGPLVVLDPTNPAHAVNKGYVDNLVTQMSGSISTLQAAISNLQAQIDALNNNKYDKTGGTISGNVVVQGSIAGRGEVGGFEPV